ncbi:MAG TPA: hypothetical protein VH599_13260, partial [Ktedonobacterales bacterium]
LAGGFAGGKPHRTERSAAGTAAERLTGDQGCPFSVSTCQRLAAGTAALHLRPSRILPAKQHSREN